LAREAKKLDIEVIIDTNGSNPDVVLNLADHGLVDQVEIGLKGFSKIQAVKTTNVDSTLCWDNPLRLFSSLTKKYPQVKTLASFVIWQGITDKDLQNGFDLFEKNQTDNMFMRFTNVEYPLNEKQIEIYGEHLKTKLSKDSPSVEVVDALIRHVLAEKYSLRLDLLPIPEQEMVDRITAICQGSFWEGRTVLVLNRIGHEGAKGTEGLVWL